MENRSKLVIIDGSSVLVRAFFATVYPGRPIRSHNGIYTNAVMGFLNMMFAALEQLKPSHLFIAWDVSRDTFRRTLYPAYKGTRGELPDELLMQFNMMQEVLEAMGIAQSHHPDYEADDIIGTLAMNGEQMGYEVCILTGDRDALQLVRPRVTVGIMKKGMTDVLYFTPDLLRDTYGVSPTQMVDVKSLMGDTSDNIPGVPGVGEKTALRLIQAHGSLEGVMQQLDAMTGKLKERLTEHRDLAFLSKTLATIVLDVPTAPHVTECRLCLNLQSGVEKLASLNLQRSVALLEQFGTA